MFVCCLKFEQFAPFYYIVTIYSIFHTINLNQITSLQSGNRLKTRNLLTTLQTHTHTHTHTHAHTDFSTKEEILFEDFGRTCPPMSVEKAAYESRVREKE
jgi:hypothetical protein